ncbi:hypothetical protein KDK77_01070 [bacterium]|nr:hypothetical protein [bacterium]
MNEAVKSYVMCKSRLAMRLTRKIDFRYFLLPLVISVVMAWIFYEGIYTARKPFFEQASIISLSSFAGISFLRFILKRQPFFLWATALLAVLLCREIHFSGSDELFYAGIFSLFIVALVCYEPLEKFLGNSFVLTFIAMGFFSYFLTYTYDHRWWRFVPGEKIFEGRLEEFMELFSHCVVGLTLIVSRETHPASAAELADGSPKRLTAAQKR